MSIQKKEIHGYIARCYWDHDEMYGYARIISPICQSPADTVDAIIEYLKEYFREMDERELSKQEWKAAKKNILDRLSENAEFNPGNIPELKDHIVPVSISVTIQRFSDKLVKYLRKNIGTP